MDLDYWCLISPFRQIMKNQIYVAQITALNESDPAFPLVLSNEEGLQINSWRAVQKCEFGVKP
jgi:hypothetical protein